MTSEREAMTLPDIRAEIESIEYECHKSALTLGVDGLRGMCIEAQKRLHKLLPPLDALSRAAEPVLILGECGELLWQQGGPCQLPPNTILYAQPPEPARDVDRLVRELDVALNGEGAARQASLCDIVSQCAEIVRRRGAPILAWSDSEKAHFQAAAELVLEREKSARDAARLRKCLSFFKSVIKSGEPWTAVCQAEYEAAMAQESGE